MSVFNIRAGSANFGITIPLGPTAPKVTGYGAISDVERPHRRTATEYKGTPALRMTIPFLLDGYPGASQEPAIDALERMARPDDGAQPPKVVVAGPLPHTDLVWWVEDIDWADAPGEVIYIGPERFRQAGTLHLCEVVTVELIVQSSPTARARARSKAKTVAPIRAPQNTPRSRVLENTLQN